MVSAVLRKEVVSKIRVSDFPKMSDYHVHFFWSQIQIIRPQITRFEVIVLSHLVVIWQIGEDSVKKTRQTKDGIKSGTRDSHLGRVSHTVIQELTVSAIGTGFFIDAKERMTKGGARAICIVRRKNKTEGIGFNHRTKALVY